MNHMLPNTFVKTIEICLLVIGFYDTTVYAYAVWHRKERFDFFGHKLPPTHPLIMTGFGVVLAFYYVVGLTMLMFG